MSKDFTSKKSLLSLFNKMGSQQGVSVMVGAGFSMNVSPLCMTWVSLLKDMVLELYGDEVERKMSIVKIETPTLLEKDLEDKLLDICWEIINKIGYLELVSQYETRKGYREAIEYYIEQRMPVIDRKKKSMTIRQLGKTIPNIDKLMDVHKALLDCSWQYILTTNYDGLLEYAQSLNGQKASHITHDYELSFSDNSMRIIKIHGDLSKSTSDNFNFDGCTEHKYIITKEDYDNYPIRHEAFTQFMRINLLQGVFCLIGFSGDDPNFINWIKWVRNVLVKSQGNTSSEPKIYLISLEKEPQKDPAKSSFYENHRIALVQLYDKEVLSLIGASDTEDKRSVILKFLRYLSKSSMQKEKLLSDNWGKVYPDPFIYEDEIIDKTAYDLIFALAPNYRFLSNVESQNKCLKYLLKTKNWDAYKLSLLVEALWEINSFPMFLNDRVKKILSQNDAILCKNVIQKYNYLLSIENIYFDVDFSNLTNKLELDEGTYLRCLKDAYSFDFTALNEHLNKWKISNNQFDQRYASLQYLCDKKTKAIKTLKAHLARSKTPEDKYVTAQLLNICEGKNSPQYSVKQFSGIFSLSDYKNKLLKKISSKDEEINTFDANNISQVVGPFEDKIRGYFRFFPFFIEYGLTFNNFLTETEWYPIAESLYQKLPIPTMFYSVIFLSDEQTLRKITQLYAFTDELKETNETLMKNLLDAYTNNDTPKHIQEKLIIVAEELIISVKSSIWIDKLFAIWSKYFIPNYCHPQINLTNIMPYLIGKSSINKLENIIKDFIECYDKNIDLSIYISFYFNTNKDLHKVEISSMKDKLENMINNIEDSDDLKMMHQLYVLIDKAGLGDSFHNKIIELISLDSFSPHNTYSIISTYLITDAEKKILIKKILEDKDLWNTGYNGFGIGNFSYIPIEELSSLPFTDLDIQNIFTKLPVKITELSSFLSSQGKGSFANQISTPLYEMESFLIRYKKHITAGNKEIEELQNRINKILYDCTQVQNMSAALMSIDEYKVANALEQLRYEIRNKNIKEHLADIEILIDGCLWPNSLLQSRLWTIGSLLMIDDKTIVEKFTPKLEMLLKHYQEVNYAKVNLNMKDLYYIMGFIAKKLDANGHTSVNTSYWLDEKKKNRFNILELNNNS